MRCGVGTNDHVLGAPARIMSQENNSHVWSSDNIKSSSQVRSCIADLSAWKVKKKRSILNSKSNSLENIVIACELENVASVSGKNHLDKGRNSEMGVNTYYEGDLVMSSSEIGTCLLKNTCDGVEETSGKNPFKSSGTNRDLETCSDSCNDISKDHNFVTSESKSVSEVENWNEAVPNVDNCMTTESGDFVEVNNGAIEMRGIQIYPRLEVLITYSRKKRKNSCAPASSLPSIIMDATSSFPVTENKTTTTSSDHYQVSKSYSNNLSEEVIAGGGTLLMGVQQMLLDKAAGDSSCTETWNKKESVQVDNQKENINSSMASTKYESPIDSKAENYEQEKRNETDAVVNVSCDIEFSKESSHYTIPCDLIGVPKTPQFTAESKSVAVPNIDNSMTTESGDFVEVNNAAIEMRGIQIYPRPEVLITYSRKRRKNSSAPASSLPSSFLVTKNKTTTTSSDQYQVSIPYSNNLPEEVIAGGGTFLMDVQQMLLEKAAGDNSCTEIWNKKEAVQIDKQKENINSSMASIKDESPIDSKEENYEQEKRNETDAVVNVSCDVEFAKETSHYAIPCNLKASNDIHSIVTTNEPLNGERQSATEDIPSQSRASGFVGGWSQITNMGIIPPLGKAFNARSSKKLLVLDVNGLLADIVPLRYVPYSLEANIIVSGKAVFKRPFHDDFLQFCFERFNVGVWSSRIKRNMELVLDFLLGDAKHKLFFCWDQSHCTDTGFPVVGKNRSKPIILKKLKKLWEKYEPDLPWERGEYDESNTLLLDDSPHKALCNPPNTAIFPNSYHYMDEKDDSLGPGGDLRVYLEGLSTAENIQKYVESNPFGQRPITEKNASWRYYCKVIEAATYLQESGANKFSTYKCRY